MTGKQTERNRPGRIAPLALGMALLAGGSQARACATCGCSLSSDGASGFTATAGWRLMLQFDYLDQDQLRSGTGAIAPAQVAALNTPAPGAGREVENRTVNRYTTVGLNYAPTAEWNLKLLVPYLDRSHSTDGGAGNPITPDLLSSAVVTGLGDLKVIASYQGFLPGHNLGLQLGVKLPTGDFGGQNGNGGPIVGRHPATFGPGGTSGGMVLDASLQAGTGSTDAVIGAYFLQSLNEAFTAYATCQFQAALHQRLDLPGSDFRPGRQGNLTLGLRHEGHPDLVPQLQINLSHKGADQGALADAADSAGTVAYLSPGVDGRVMEGMRAFAFLQLPFASNLSGFQLLPRWTASAGLVYHF